MSNFLKEHKDSVNKPLLDGVTTLLCRASYLEKKNMVTLLLHHGADINLPCGGKGNTGVMWASSKDAPKMVEFLIEKGADLQHENKEGHNALDLATIRMSFESAKILYKNGLRFKETGMYLPLLRHEYDIQMFMEFVAEDMDITAYNIFYEKVNRERAAWEARDLVLDPNETWK